MPHHTSLIATIVAGLGLAFVFGALAQRLRLPPLVGYLVAGVVIGPFTPGYVADQELAPQLAEIGVILLMFGVGLHFSVKDLMAVRNIAVPGAVAQIVRGSSHATSTLSCAWSTGRPPISPANAGMRTRTNTMARSSTMSQPTAMRPRSVSTRRRSWRARSTTTVLATESANPKTRPVPSGQPSR